MSVLPSSVDITSARSVRVSEPSYPEDIACEARVKALTGGEPQFVHVLNVDLDEPPTKADPMIIPTTATLRKINRRNLSDSAETPSTAAPQDATSAPTIPDPYDMVGLRDYGDLDDERRGWWAQLRASKIPAERLHCQRMIDVLGVAMGMSKYEEAQYAARKNRDHRRLVNQVASEARAVAEWDY